MTFFEDRGVRLPIHVSAVGLTVPMIWTKRNTAERTLGWSW